MTLSLPIFAGGFNDAVEDSKTPNSRKTTQQNSGGTGDACTDSCVDACAQTLVQLLAMGWLLNNLTCSYTNFPYERLTPNYVYNSQIGSNKKTRFSFSTNMFYLEGLGPGNETSFEGLLFPIIGPYIDNIIIVDRSDDNSSSNAKMGNLRLGAQLSLLQNDYICCTGIMQWSHWYGDASDSIKNGIALGLDVRSFPFYPVGLMWKIMYCEYDNDVCIVESNLEAGIFVKKTEFFAGWKYMSIGNSETGKRSDYWNGLFAGLRVYF